MDQEVINQVLTLVGKYMVIERHKYEFNDGLSIKGHFPKDNVTVEINVIIVDEKVYETVTIAKYVTGNVFDSFAEYENVWKKEFEKCM